MESEPTWKITPLEGGYKNGLLEEKSGFQLIPLKQRLYQQHSYTHKLIYQPSHIYNKPTLTYTNALTQVWGGAG